MKRTDRFSKVFSILSRDWGVTLGIFFAILVSLIVLRSIAPFVFPLYFIFIVGSTIAFFVISMIEFDILAIFSPIFYIGSLAFLVLPIIFGQVTRGAVRWIPLGPISLQPAEIVRPFLLLFFSFYVHAEPMTAPRFVKTLALMAVPLFLILFQPSLGVTILTTFAFLGILFTVPYTKRLILPGILVILLVSPLVWTFMAPYQKTRVESLIAPHNDPSGAGYNSIQSMIAVGSGKLTGRGLGQGVQTQLSFLPERHTDFIFASVSEELGFVGATLLLIISFFLLSRFISIGSQSKSKVVTAYATGAFATLTLQTVVHVGMNMGLFPITGLPLPLISYGGSSLLSTMIIYAVLLSGKHSRL
jgi:rod shape determining protein RodA